MQTRTCTRTRANSRRKRTSDNPSCTIVHWLWVACAALCTCQAGRGLQPWRPKPEACAKIAAASGHTPAHEHEGLSSIFLYGRIPDFSRSVRKEPDIMCLSCSSFHPIADNCCKATWSQTELPVAFHGKDNWECLGLYHRNHKNKGFNGNGHSPGPVISRCVACVFAIHAQVLGVWAPRLDGRAPPAMCMATHRQPTADEQPGWQGVRHTEEHFTKASLHPFQAITMVWDAQNRLYQ